MRLLLALVLLCPAWVMADTDDFVLGLFRLERCAFMSSSDNARVDRVEECRDILADVDATFTELGDLESAELVDSLAENWAQLTELYDRGFDDPTSFRDHYTSDDIRLNRIALVETLGDRIPSPPNPVALAVLMERTASEYIWRAEATMGAGMSATEILDLETMVMDMDGQFENLRDRFPQDSGLRYAYSRYQFIRGSLLNYNSDTVPYLVDRYSSDITEVLRKMERVKS
ncbi:hypothetical protein [Alcanivorax sp. 1008]|uniref:hypothetical protein n=1 Tax=Alcanivorax sp. 1008 TaxID=2816853 RepID=UPI001DFF42AF|nr:hypothetical protein [Alcanivorax sp. 1008]MCC1495903.1 hypothetical protein [Alcanivorax sp. 1008]